MSKLTKDQSKKHTEAMRLLEKDLLAHEDILFIFENYQESGTNVNSVAGAFFTPFGLARDTLNEIGVSGASVVDLCAGIGALAYQAFLHGCRDITCVEMNPEYLEIGRKIVPSANWVLGSIFDFQPDRRFDFAVSNPPFGNIARPNDGLGGFEFSAAKKASDIADISVFIMPQTSTPFRYSGNQCYSEKLEGRYADFSKKTGINFEFNAGIDTSVYLDEWHGVKPLCEVCIFYGKAMPKEKQGILL